MSVTLKQADGSLVTPLDDARLYALLSGSASGVVSGCTVTALGGLQLRVAEGWGLVQGRVFVVEEETLTVQASAGGSVPGRLLLHLDTQSETPAAFLSQAGSPLPALTQEEINAAGSVYELPLATYTVSELSVSNLQAAAPAAVVKAPGALTADTAAVAAKAAAADTAASATTAATATKASDADKINGKALKLTWTASTATLAITW